MSTLLVLGGGSSQLSGLRRSLKMGHRVIVADINPEAPGCALAHEVVKASTFDPQAVIRAAREHKVDGILTMGSDQPVLTQAIAAEELGLPSFLSPEAALKATNKKAMKTELRNARVPLPPFTIMNADSRDIPEMLKTPAVIKPLDSQGQRGIFYLTDRKIPAETVTETLSFSRQREFITEEFFPGGEVTLSGWLCGGRLQVFSITDRVTRHLLPRLGVCFAHRYPSMYVERTAEITTVAETALAALDISEGPVYIQLFVGTDEIVINEVACRLGGAYEDEFIPLITGIDILDLLIRGTLGEKIRSEDTAPRVSAPPAISVPLLFCRPGTIHHWRNTAEARTIPGMLTYSPILPEGTVIGSTENSTQRAAYAIIVRDTQEEVNTSVEEFFRTAGPVDASNRPLFLDSRPEIRFPIA